MESRSIRTETCPDATFVKGKKANLSLLSPSIGIEGEEV